jgi:hypothetical protein
MLLHKLITIKLLAFCQFLPWSNETGICQMPSLGYTDSSDYFKFDNDADLNMANNGIIGSKLCHH